MNLKIKNKHFAPGLNVLSLAWLLLLSLASISSKAQTNAYWTPNIGNFDNYMTITSYFLLNDEELGSNQFEIACFIEGECRGSYRLQEMPYLGHTHPGFLSIWGSSSDNGKAIVVKIYDHQTLKVYQANESPQFLYNESIGIDVPYKFTITIAGEYSVQTASSEGGTVNANASASRSGETITLTLSPNEGYQTDLVSVYKTGDQSSSVSLSGTGNTRTFIMPDFGVSVSATFKKTNDLLDLELAEKLLENETFVVAQETANTQNEVVNWLVGQINLLIQTTGIYVSASDIAINSFAPATKGSAENLLGSNGNFSFTVALKKGNNSITTELKTVTIEATPYTFKAVHIAFIDNDFVQITNTGNIPTGELSITLSGEHTADFTISTGFAESLNVDSQTSITIIPQEGLPTADYIVSITVEADNLEPTSITFTYKVINTSASFRHSEQSKVWSSNGRLNILASTDGKAYIYNVLGKLVEVVDCNQAEQKQISLKQGVYIVAVGGKSCKVVVN